MDHGSPDTPIGRAPKATDWPAVTEITDDRVVDGCLRCVYAAAFEGHAEALAGRLDAIRAAAVAP